MATDRAHASIWADLQGVAFEQGYADARGIRTRFLHAGRKDQPAVLFLHGTGGHAEAYCRNLEAHAAHFDTYAVDMLGHGYTDKPPHDYSIPDYVAHLVAFLDARGLEKVSLSGESLGGWVAAHFAVAHPSRVERLVLNTAGGDLIDAPTLARIREITMAAVTDPSWERLKARLEWLVYDKSLVHDDLIACRQHIYSLPEMSDAMKHILSMHTPEARQRYALTDEQWASIQAPALVLWTSHDPSAPVTAGERVAAKLRNARFVVMQDCGHWPQFEDAATFNRIHIDFLLDR
jgi:2-hydroxy-6-oxonona-2,4-dienedioate hydrolase